MSMERMPRRVRAWYGLPGEIVIEGDYWHWVKAGPVPLPHPPLVNLFVRQGLPRDARFQLSYWHEMGHIQTLPLALAYVVWLWRRRSKRRPRSVWARGLRLIIALIAHEAAWELAAEGYVIAKGGRMYPRLYRTYRNPLPALFWGGIAAIAALGTLFLLREEER